MVLKAPAINRDKSVLQSQITKPKCNVKRRLNEISKLPIAINETGLKAYSLC